MEGFVPTSDKPYSTLRLLNEPEFTDAVQSLQDSLAESLADTRLKAPTAHADQSMYLEAHQTSPISPLSSANRLKVGGAVAAAHIDSPLGDFQTFNTVLGSTFPYTGTALEKHYKRAGASIAESAIDSNQIVYGFPIHSLDKNNTTLGVVQLALSKQHFRAMSGRERITLQMTQARHSQRIAEQAMRLHDIHQRAQLDETLFESLELATPQVAPNSITLTFDLVNSTERALVEDDGAFHHFLNTWKRNVKAILAYHELTDRAEVIGDLGDGLSVVFWLDSNVNPYSEGSVASFQSSVVDKVRRDIATMSRELADGGGYEKDLDTLTFNAAETPGFTYVHSPLDRGGRAGWLNAHALKQQKK